MSYVLEEGAKATTQAALASLDAWDSLGMEEGSLSEISITYINSLVKQRSLL